MKSMLKVPATKHLKLKCDAPLSNFAFKFNVRRYIVATTPAAGAVGVVTLEAGAGGAELVATLTVAATMAAVENGGVTGRPAPTGSGRGALSQHAAGTSAGGGERPVATVMAAAVAVGQGGGAAATAVKQPVTRPAAAAATRQVIAAAAAAVAAVNAVPPPIAAAAAAAGTASARATPPATPPAVTDHRPGIASEVRPWTGAPSEDRPLTLGPARLTNVAQLTTAIAVAAAVAAGARVLPAAECGSPASPWCGAIGRPITVISMATDLPALSGMPETLELETPEIPEPGARLASGRAVQVDPVKPTLIAPGNKRLKLTSDSSILLSILL